jgi:hypothetical protein
MTGVSFSNSRRVVDRNFRFSIGGCIFSILKTLYYRADSSGP